MKEGGKRKEKGKIRPREKSLIFCKNGTIWLLEELGRRKKGL